MPSETAKASQQQVSLLDACCPNRKQRPACCGCALLLAALSCGRPALHTPNLHTVMQAGQEFLPCLCCSCILAQHHAAGL